MMRFVFLFVTFLMVSFSSSAESFRHPAEYLYPEIPQALAKKFSYKTAITCGEVARIEMKLNKTYFDSNLMADTYSHSVFWDKSAEILSRSGSQEAPQLSDANEKYLESLVFSDNQKYFTARDKLFLIEQGWASRVEDKEFVHSAVYSECHQKVTKVISGYLTSQLEKGEG